MSDEYLKNTIQRLQEQLKEANRVIDQQDRALQSAYKELDEIHDKLMKEKKKQTAPRRVIKRPAQTRIDRIRELANRIEAKRMAQ